MTGPPDGTVGLCATCGHVRRIRSDRGSIFYLCKQSAIDPRFPKYPRLPVLACPAYLNAGVPVPNPSRKNDPPDDQP